MSSEHGGTARAGSSSIPDCFDEARRTVERERRILSREADAFREFHRRVQSVEVGSDAGPQATAGQASDTQGVVARRVEPGTSTGSPVRRAYVETVMDVAHYEAEYGESYREHLAAEFGEELATALRQEPGLPAFLKRQVLAAARDAKSDRERTLAILDREEAALDEAETDLRDVAQDLGAIASRPIRDCRWDELRRLREDLETLQARCSDLADRRQSGDLHPTVSVPDSAVNGFSSLNEYLYGSMEPTYPVLSVVARLGDRIERIGDRVDRALAGNADRRS